MIVRHAAGLRILANLEKVIYGKTEALSLVLVALLADFVAV